MSDVLLSLWRTAVPYVVTFLAVQAARLGVHLNDATLTSELTVAGGTAYYALARILEARFPKFGWLLGAPKAPTYTPAKGALPPIGPGPAAARVSLVAAPGDAPVPVAPVQPAPPVPPAAPEGGVSA